MGPPIENTENLSSKGVEVPAKEDSAESSEKEAEQGNDTAATETDKEKPAEKVVTDEAEGAKTKSEETSEKEQEKETEKVVTDEAEAKSEKETDAEKPAAVEADKEEKSK